MTDNIVFNNTAIGVWFELTNKANEPTIKLVQDTWDGTELAFRCHHATHPLNAAWDSLDQNDWQEQLIHGFMMIPRGMYERSNANYYTQAIAMLWIHDEEDPIAIVQNIQSKLGVAGENVRINVFLLDHPERLEDDPPGLFRWKSYIIHDLEADSPEKNNTIMSILDEAEDAIDL